MWVGVALALVVAFNFGVFDKLAEAAHIPHGLVPYTPLIVLVALWGAILIHQRHRHATPEAMRPSVQNKLVDDYIRRQRWILAAIIPLTVLLSFNQPTTDRFTQILFVSYMLLAAFALVRGPGFLDPRFRAAINDELSRALRGRAAGIGYVCAMGAMSADYLLSQFAPQALALAIPLSMAAVFVLPATYLLWSEWRASRDG